MHPTKIEKKNSFIQTVSLVSQKQPDFLIIPDVPFLSNRILPYPLSPTNDKL